uniref:Tyrosine-protein kinase n=1 Tax=Panagrolaimus sp. ES5 TaxID=591445 RepID=A0AC34FHP1_9BILA
MPKDPLAASSRAKKKKNNNDDPMGVSQSRKSRKKKEPEKKATAASAPSPAADLDRSTKKKRVVVVTKKEETPKPQPQPQPTQQQRNRQGSQKEARKEHASARKPVKEQEHGSTRKQVKEPAPPPSTPPPPPKKEKSPKYEFDPKVIETPNVKKLKVEVTLKSEEENKAKKETLARPESIRTGLKKCVHMWPTPADIDKLKSTPKPWSIPQVRQTQNLEYFLGRVPQWYIEEKFLKNPGDFLVSRDPTNKFILSVKTKESGNPFAHFVVEFTETQLVRNDRNYYHRIVGTVPQSNTVQGLIQKYKDSQTGMLKQNTKRDAELLTAILPCQSCIYSTQEYNYHYVFVRNPKDVTTKEQIAKGEGYRLYKGTRAIRLPTIVESIIVRPVIVKEYDTQNAETLDMIVREMHIVQTIRFKLGVNTVVNIEGIVTVQKPFHVLYKVCSEGSLLEYLKAHSEDVKSKEKLLLLQDLACTLYQVYKLGYLHSDISAQNIFVDIKEIVIKNLKEVTDSKKARFLIGGWKNATMEKTKKFDADKYPLVSCRYLAPEIFTTNLLNESTEVYAFGLLIYEVFLLQKPYKDISDADVKKYLQDNASIRPEMTDEIPEDAQKLIRECLEEDATKRPPMIEVWRRLRTTINEPAAKSISQKTAKTQQM